MYGKDRRTRSSERVRHWKSMFTETTMQNGVFSPATITGSYSHFLMASRMASLKSGKGGLRRSSLTAQAAAIEPSAATRASPIQNPLLIRVLGGSSGNLGSASTSFLGGLMSPPILTAPRWNCFFDSAAQRSCVLLSDFCGDDVCCFERAPQDPEERQHDETHS